MSRENVEVVRQWLWAFDNDTDAFRQITHPEIERMPIEHEDRADALKAVGLAE
jgi:hypothetical protein